MNNYEKMVKSFEVEELEERVEFAKWTLKADVKCNNQGCEGSGSIQVAI